MVEKDVYEVFQMDNKIYSSGQLRDRKMSDFDVGLVIT